MAEREVKTQERPGPDDEAPIYAPQTMAMVRAAANLPADAPQWNDERIRAIRSYSVPKGAKCSVQELSVFLSVCNKYDLDPMVGEIWLANLKDEDSPGPAVLKVVTGRDAYLKVALRQPGYAGHDSGVVYEKDVFKFVRKGGGIEVIHETSGFLPKDRGEIVGAYCVVYHKERKPVVVMRRASDYAHLFRKKNWSRYKEDMMETRVITAAFRRMFNLAGLYVESEFGDPDAAAEQATDSVKDNTAKATDALRERITTARATVVPEPPAPAEPATGPEPPAVEVELSPGKLEEVAEVVSVEEESAAREETNDGFQDDNWILEQERKKSKGD